MRRLHEPRIRCGFSPCGVSIGNCSNGFAVNYEGDPNYATASAFFSLTNPPIPSTGGGTNATATPALSPTDTSVPGTPTPTLALAGDANFTLSTGTPAGNTGGGYLWLIAVLVLIALGGGASGFWFLRRRAQSAAVSAMSTPDSPFSGMTEPIQPPDGDSTQS